MLNLNNTDEIKKLDPVDTIGITEKILEQCEAAWEQVTNLDIPKLEGIKTVIFCGMGASIYGALVLKSLLGTELQFPTEIISDYFLPDYVGKDTLVVLTSYSGTTEEVLSCAEEAKAKEAMIIILTKGGSLAEFAKDNNIPAYIFDGKLNSGNVPRLGAGYTILGLIGLLNKANVINIEEEEISQALNRMKEKFAEVKQQALHDYEIFINKIPIIFSAEHLSGNAQILRNQFNETSKVFSSFFLIPDLNHHLMEGLQFPTGAPLHFIIFNSPNYSDKIKKRVELTIEVVRKNNYPVHEFTTSGQSLYDDFLEVLIYGSFLTLYLSLAYKQNPAINPWVDWFKNQLTEPSKEKIITNF
ncbi:MAG TPA: SIS domain-containing protein [Candidatus Sulfotelmatobacter sp.]|jgi:glucose/mannose-6-phosphate isomerase|nr:SIS domain-containing protein [Candidatus Sulfotelmatobacter sp.]